MAVRVDAFTRGSRVNSACWQALAAMCALIAAAAAIWLPSATGAGPLAGRRFGCHGLARLADNAGVLLGSGHSWTATVLAAALTAAPAFALAAAVLSAGARWTGQPARVARAAACVALLPVLAAVAACLVLLVGPYAGVYLQRTPSPGLLLCGAAAMLASVCAWRAARVA